MSKEFDGFVNAYMAGDDAAGRVFLDWLEENDLLERADTVLGLRVGSYHWADKNADRLQELYDLVWVRIWYHGPLPY